jgi:hypothetical protein
MKLPALARGLLGRPKVRPWALATPVLVLLVAIPMLRPLRHPLEIPRDEQLRLATVRALVEHGTLAIDDSAVLASPVGLITVGKDAYSIHPPALSLVLAPVAWLLDRAGINFTESFAVVAYVLTLVGVTLPAALGAGLVYRMGRLFELPRPARTGLAMLAALGGGLLSYSVVLNPHAPAAALVLCATACLIQLGMAPRQNRAGGWVALAGLSAGFAAVIEPTASVLAILFILVIAAQRVSLGTRLGAMLLYIAGLSPALALHAAWNVPITGDLLPASWHLAPDARMTRPPDLVFEPEDDGARVVSGAWVRVGGYVERIFVALFGSHGLISHFPAVVLGAFGCAVVIRRHWPAATRMLALVSLAGSAMIFAWSARLPTEWSDAMYASRWFIVFTPLLLFWTGALFTHRRGAALRFLALVLVLFSTLVTLIGVLRPYPPGGYAGYTPVAVLKSFFSRESPRVDTRPRVVAASPHQVR